MLTVFAVISLAVFMLVKPLNKITLWVFLAPLFDHILLIKFGDLIPAITINRLFIISILFFYLASKHKGNLIKTTEYGRLERWMLLFILVFILNIFMTYRPKDAGRNIITIFDCFIMPFLMYFILKYYVQSWEAVNKIYFALLSIGVIVSIMGIYEQITWIDLVPYVPDRYEQGIRGLREFGSFVRANGPYMTPEAYGGVLSMTWFVALFKLRIAKVEETGNRSKKLLLFLILLTITAGVIMCMFRSIWLGLIAGLIIHIILLPGKGKRLLFYLALILLVMTLVEINSNTFSNFIEGRLFHKESMYSRYGAYEIVWKAFSENPIMGLGYNRFEYYASHLNIDRTITYEGVWAADTPHNMFFSILAENGMVGFIPFFFLMATILKKEIMSYNRSSNIREREWNSAMLGICAAYYLPWLFETTGYYAALNSLFFMLFGITMKMKEFTPKNKHTEQYQ